MLPKLFFIIISTLISSFTFTNSYTQCLHHQKTLLLQLKDELNFNSSLSTKLVRWNERDECCKWHGVECDVAGYVVSLQLDNESISGGIADSTSLFELVHLQKLNLAYNDFDYDTPIPKGIHNLTYLTHLNLSYAGFGGQVPAEISSLRRLVSLDISSVYIFVKLEMLVRNLTGLRELYLDGVDVTSSHERRKWSHIISSYLPNLTALSLSGCGLSGPLAKSFWQLHSLSILQLDYNNLGTELPDLFANFPSLTTLSLVNCSLKGSIPPTFANLTNLIRLDLSDNSFSGNIPHSLFANLTKLIRLDLSSNFFTGSLSSMLFEGLSNLVYLHLWANSFSGNIPHSLFALPSLLELDLRSNQFNGTFQLDKFLSLANLTLLDLSHNRLSVDVGNLNSTSYGSLQLKVLRLASCNLSHFPNFIKHSDDLIALDLSYNRIGGEIPSWIWGTQLGDLDLSFNLLTDLQKPYHIPASLEWLYLQSNQLKGELYLPIPPASQLSELLLANNSLSGSIPTSLCTATSLHSLDLSGNRLSGSIPPCLLENIPELDLSQNNISGSIPDDFPMDCWLQYLDLNNNTLEGKIPKSLERCEWLQLLNLGNNNINDSFPCMLSSMLRVLVLHSNRFYGEVRCQNMSWPYLQILDISSNQFSGNLESINFSSWETMMLQIGEPNSPFQYSQLWSSLSITLIMKGTNSEYHTIWPEFGIIDFSCNNFGGDIPNAIGDLTSLHQLNLSHNALNGSIPNSFGQLRNLESLDLSVNRLIGPIPVELAGLTFLQVLNLSYNKLVGEIPNGRQLQTFSADSFKGNAGLCGFNLNISCSDSDDSHHLWPEEDENGEEKSEIEWEYVSSTLGYVVGLGSIAWTLLCRRSFRERYFEKIEEIVDKIFYERARRRRHERRRRIVEMRNEVRRQQRR